MSALATLATMAAVLAGGSGHAAAAPPLLQASVDPHERGRAVPEHFVGFSYELPSVQFDVVGNRYTGVDEPLARLMDRISAGNGAPVLRLGGVGADAAWWNPSGAPRPPGIEFDLTPFYLEGIAAFQRRTHMPIELGVNMAAGRPGWAAQTARAAVQALGAGNISAIEVGNEPDVYPRRPYDSTGRNVRPRGWGFDDYLREYPRFVTALRRVSGRLRLSAPDAATWESQIQPFLRRERRRVDLLSYHHYPLTDCPGDPTDIPNTIDGLLSRRAQGVAARKFDFLMRIARRAHRPLRLSETNSSDCGWRPNGISDRFASALWGADWLFLMAANGLNGVNFHASGAMAPLFTNWAADRNVHTAAVQPLYYGIDLFSQAVAGHGRVLVRTTLRQKARGNVIAWAVRDRRGTVRVVVIDKERRRSGRVVLRIPGASRVASLERLTAPALDAQRQSVRLAGQGYGDITTTGNPDGAPVSERVHRRGRAYTFRLPAASAAMLTVRRG